MEDASLLLPDRISNLPDNVAEAILMFLSTRDAVRTSILSSKWRHFRTKLPQFVLDDTLLKNVDKKHCTEITLAKLLCQLLLPHDGPIYKFTLSSHELKSCPEIDSLMSFLAKNNHLEDLTLELWKDSYLLPTAFFSFDKLKHLKLMSCSIRSSLASQGFRMLTTMVLIAVEITAEMLSRLISACPLLSALELELYSEMDICIDAPNLKTFILYGDIKSIHFKRVPVLASVSIDKLNMPDGTATFVGVGFDTIKFFQMLPLIKSLELCYCIRQGFVDINHRKLPNSLIYLDNIKLNRISFNEMVDLSFTFCLLRSSPNLKFIDIEFDDFSDSDSKDTVTYMEGEDYSDICLNELKEVTLEGVTGTKPELEFTRLILANSPSLKSLHIHTKETVDDNGFKILKEVIKFRRMSTEAEIIFAE